MATKRTSDSQISTHLVQLGEGGVLTLALPEMKGRYIVIEQRAGTVIISPFDLEITSQHAAIARRSGNTMLLGDAATADRPNA